MPASLHNVSLQDEFPDSRRSFVTLNQAAWRISMRPFTGVRAIRICSRLFCQMSAFITVKDVDAGKQNDNDLLFLLPCFSIKLPHVT